MGEYCGVTIERRIFLFTLILLILADSLAVWALFDALDLCIKDLHDVRDLFLFRLNLFACPTTAQ